MIAVEIVGAAVIGGFVGAAVTIRNMPHMVAKMNREQRLKFARMVSALADDD